MSDHGAGPRSIANPEIDITDVFAFPSPERPGNLVLVMCIFPFKEIEATRLFFSDALDYRLRVRPIRIAASGPAAAFAVGDQECHFSFAFDVPKMSGGRMVQTGVCRSPLGDITVRVGDEEGAQSYGAHIFAGCRLDPFFVDQLFSGGIRMTRKIPPITAVNSVEGQNVLSIVVEVEHGKLFGADASSLVAVVAETATNGSFRARLDRVGRPEIKNFIMMDKTADTVNRDLDVRDLYSEEDGFKLRPDYLGAYRARLNGSMSTYDSLDGKTDWPLDKNGTHPLTEMLLADFLVVDMSKSFDEDGYLEIELAMLDGTEHKTCGGRWVNHDIVDSLFTILINKRNGPRISDGVDQTAMPAPKVFPYLSPPNPMPPKLAPLVGIPT
ncbi:hypothetical protein GCM10010869_71030 [Mesorhizobium tianshanense]|uniref:Uncharacterized protein DUF4331 n=2 Tax=Mesorhizobium tianshanense TaxID=39844 RepID=A0A562MH56_9HYPH|nr:uncharacterized protein DUF4331 [Mesorhizobium tianshanense]GLS41506.1 hypothetical protein GCM10010869_71030 [Mesorhizobium tianshanense]